MISISSHFILLLLTFISLFVEKSSKLVLYLDKYEDEYEFGLFSNWKLITFKKLLHYECELDFIKNKPDQKVLDNFCKSFKNKKYLYLLLIFP